MTSLRRAYSVLIQRGRLVVFLLCLAATACAANATAADGRQLARTVHRLDAGEEVVGEEVRKRDQ